MTLLAPWALAGLVLLAPLVVLHLRHRRPPVREVPTLLLDDPETDVPQARSRRWGRPPLPLLLALQLLAVVLLVLAIADPTGAPRRPDGAATAYVLDGSVWMGATDAGTGDRMEAARRRLRSLVARGDGSRTVAVVLAGPAPRVLYRGAADDLSGRVLAGAEASKAGSTLTRATALAADLRSGPDAPVVVLHAPENAAPHGDGPLRSVTIGRTVRDRGFTTVSARCGLPGDDPCAILATVRQTAGPAADVPVRARLDGRVVATATASLPAGAGSSPVVLRAPAGANLQLEIVSPSPDALRADDTTAVSVPAAATPAVNVVAAPSRAGVLTRAFAAVPGARVRAISPAAYRPQDARDADLLVLDDWLPRGALPRARSLLLVDPPRLPGGTVRGHLADGAASGSDPTSPLLAGVDVSALTADTDAARRLVAPPWLSSVAWAPGGPLLAAGTDGMRRLAVLAFDPGASALPQSEAFPILAANIVAWSQDWLPIATRPGDDLLAQVPPGTDTTSLGAARHAGGAPAAFATPSGGVRTASQHGDWGVRTRQSSAGVDASPGAAGAVDLRVDPAAATADRLRWAPWLLLAALAVLATEWLYVLRRRPLGVTP